jgi:hypothetical protein
MTGGSVTELSTVTTLTYIFLVIINNLRTRDRCLQLINFKTVPLLMSHSGYKMLHLESQAELHCILCRTLNSVYVRQAVVILQAWTLFTNYIRVRLPARYFKVMANKAVLKKIPHNINFLLLI